MIANLQKDLTRICRHTTHEKLTEHIQTFIEKSKSSVCSVIAFVHHNELVDPTFACNWKFMHSGGCPQSGSLIVFDAQGGATVDGLPVFYRFGQTVLTVLDKIEPLQLTEPWFQYGSTGAQLDASFKMQSDPSIIVRVLPYSRDTTGLYENARLPSNLTDVCIAGHLRMGMLELVQAWAGTAQLTVLTDMTLGCVFLPGIQYTHSHDLFGRTYTPSPVPLHIQPAVGGRLAAERIWNTALVSMQQIATAKSACAWCGTSLSKEAAALGDSGRIHVHLPPWDGQAPAEAKINPYGRNLMRGKGEFSHFGPNYMFLTLFVAFVNGRPLFRFGYDYTTHDSHRSSAYSPKVAWKSAFGQEGECSEDPTVIYVGYMPYAKNTMHAWAQCAVVSVEIDVRDMDLLTKSEIPFTAFEREMIQLWEYINDRVNLFVDIGNSAMSDALSTMDAAELRRVLGPEVYAFGKDVLRITTGVDLADWLVYANMDACGMVESWTDAGIDDVDSFLTLPDGDGYEAAYLRAVCWRDKPPKSVEEFTASNLSAALGRTGTSIPLLVQNGLKFKKWDRLVFADDKMREWAQLVSVRTEDDAAAVRMMLTGMAASRLEKFMRVVSSRLGWKGSSAHADEWDSSVRELAIARGKWFF